jgi:hypothetical protein
MVVLLRGRSNLRRANIALDAANFFLADVRDALGPYLSVYLLTERQWDAARIGVVMAIATIAGIVAQTPAGALVDVTKAKRAVMVGAALLVTVASLIVPWLSSFWPVVVSQASAHAAGVVFGPALAAVTLGIFGHRMFTKRILIMLATLVQLQPPVRQRIFGDRKSSFIFSQPWRWRASSASLQYRSELSTIIWLAVFAMWAAKYPAVISRAD